MRLPSNRLVCLDLKGVSKRAPGGICTNLSPSNLLKVRILFVGAPQIAFSYRAARRVSYSLIIGVSYFRNWRVSQAKRSLVYGTSLTPKVWHSIKKSMGDGMYVDRIVDKIPLTSFGKSCGKYIKTMGFSDGTYR